MQTVQIPVEKIHLDPDQPRETYRGIDELAKTFAKVGENFSNLNTFDWEEFPSLDFMEEMGDVAEASVKIEVSDLVMASSASSTKESGFNLGGVFFDMKTGRAVATDGHILIMAPMEVLKKADDTETIFLPRAAIGTIRAIFEDTEKEENAVTSVTVSSFKADNKTALVLLIEEHGVSLSLRQDPILMPDWEAVISAPEKTVSIEKKLLRDVLRQVMAISGPEYCGIRTKFNGGLDVGFINPTVGKYQKMSVPFKERSYDADQETEIGLNVNLIQRALAACKGSDDVKIGFTSKAKPIVFNFQDLTNFTALVMPIRV